MREQQTVACTSQAARTVCLRSAYDVEARMMWKVHARAIPTMSQKEAHHVLPDFYVRNASFECIQRPSFKCLVTLPLVSEVKPQA